MRNRTLALAASSAVLALTLAAPTALADGDRHQYPDPTNCGGAVLDLVHVRSSEDGQHTRVTVAERDDRNAQVALRDADHADRNAQDIRNTAKTQARGDYNAWLAAHPNASDAEKSAALATRDGAISNADAAYENGGTALRLANARRDADRKRSYLAEVRLDQTSAHGLVVHIQLLVNQLCQAPGTDTPEPSTEPAPTPVPAPVDTPTPAPPAPIQNDQIGQAPNAVPGGGGSMADSLG